MKINAQEVARYIVNGLFATAVHYGILTMNLTLLGFKSAGFANFIAAIFGITISFLGSRYFVFKNISESIFSQGLKFGGLYGLIALLHGLVLLVWTDIYAQNYQFGFVIATVMQISLSYVGNKLLIFKV
jgi:putative flippase GtrA